MRYHFYKHWLTPVQCYRWRAARKVKRIGIKAIRDRIEALEWVLYHKYDQDGWTYHGWTYHRMHREAIRDLFKWDGVSVYDDSWWDLLHMERI